MEYEMRPIRAPDGDRSQRSRTARHPGAHTRYERRAALIHTASSKWPIYGGSGQPMCLATYPDQIYDLHLHLSPQPPILSILPATGVFSFLWGLG
jgi:hypothetical protein